MNTFVISVEQWEKQHDTFSQIFQKEGKKPRGRIDIGLSDDLLGEGYGRIGSVSDEEEEVCSVVFEYTIFFNDLLDLYS